jgi:hypothetical protein
MKIESSQYTESDLERFLDELVDHERGLLADRLEKASARLARLGPRVEAGGGDGEWSNHEVLAHIAVLSKFYGVLVHRISSGKLAELNLLENVSMRDVVGERMAQLEPAELLRMALADQARTLELLRTAEPASLRRTVRLEDGRMMSADEVARLPLINHLEMHVDQLEKALSS